MSTVQPSLTNTTVISNIFEAETDGFGSYRIPALLPMPDGKLLAFCEARAILSDHAHNKIVLKTSQDNGTSWSDQILVADAGDNALNNPLVVIDAGSGDIVLMYQEYPYTTPEQVENPAAWVSHAGQNFPSNVHEGAVETGYQGRICRTFVQRSSDGGLNWSPRVDITRQVKRPTEVTCYAGGPGIGIQLRTGSYKNRIVMPFTQGPWDNMKVYAVYSDDGGHQWQYGEVAPAAIAEHANETQMAELADGRVLLNARSYHGNHLRKTAFSEDGGISWTPLQDTPDLTEPECQGSIISLQHDAKHSGLLYCGPENQSQRIQGTLKISLDDATSWQHIACVYKGSFGYSSICQLSNNEIGVMFERDNYSAISFTRISLQNNDA
ncbi:exo-alpha-sialidase [Pseudoalteromonas sp. K222D]|uniref:sialidase family protein n=1 Tax=Pseudoalteromonas sp. K222D TaxID=2820756 RepID=UPI001AD74830|nr:sialidase family protein [Pseudoalteromonas sp. K222D]MBO7927530.1 exo-alpha-sialidase [Pseudoalteromonas sp. K222D]